MSILISPSVLNSDLANLATEVGRLKGADYVHLDVMDNHFVPNLTFGLPVVESILANTDIPADVHLMIENPDVWAPQYAQAGARSVTFHAEASSAPIRLARQIRKYGARAGIAVKPATEITPYLSLMEEFDMFLVMTVEPGFGGQSFLSAMMPKVREVRKAITESGRDIWLQVDGGVSRETISEPAAAGANMFVAGSAVFSAPDPAQEIQVLRELAEAAYYNQH